MVVEFRMPVKGRPIWTVAKCGQIIGRINRHGGPTFGGFRYIASVAGADLGGRASSKSVKGFDSLDEAKAAITAALV